MNSETKDVGVPFPWSSNKPCLSGAKEVPRTSSSTQSEGSVASSQESSAFVAGAEICTQIRYQLPAAGKTAGQVLAHSILVIEQLLGQWGPMVFKLGFTHDATWRWENELYGYAHDSNDIWQSMVVLYVATNPFGPAMLEAALIERFHSGLAALAPKF